MKRFRVLDKAEAANLAERLIGLTLTEAQDVAAKYGVKIRDMSSLGWYTNEDDLRRINVVTDDSGRVSSTTLG